MNMRATDYITPELLARYDKPGPRYTSYPTALEFHEGVDETDYRQRLARLPQGSETVSIYVHIPFCKSRCHFCGCHTALCRDTSEMDRYVDDLCTEIALIQNQLQDPMPLSAVHFGGGTPTYLPDAQMGRIFEKLHRTFDVQPSAEVSIEVNPAVTSVAQVSFLSSLGFNRISLGVQDFDERVLKAIGRRQTNAQTLGIIDAARATGFGSVNMDLIYGLPGQTRTGFDNTLKQVCAVRPDRIALYSFAWIPWIRENQKQIIESDIPSRDDKFAFFAAAMNRFMQNGYLQIGMDHFALKTDELARAASEGTLFRNFMGYTVIKSKNSIGLGVSAIGYLDGAFFQNEKANDAYGQLVQKGALPICKGLVLSDDDLIRASVITELMCNFKVDIPEFEKKWQIRFDSYFSEEMAMLAAQRDDARQGHELAFTEADEPLMLTDVGRLFVRNVCMLFDRYLKDKVESRPLFSRTV